MASYTGAVDCRNLKYQGTLQGRTYAGIGMVLEQDFTFVVSDWKGVLPSGHTLLVLPSRDYFYGNLGNNRPDGVCSLSMDN